MIFDNHLETIIGVSIAFIAVLVTQLIFMRVRKKNAQKLGLWNRIYQKQETKEEFDGIYAVSRPKHQEKDAKVINQEHNAFLKIKNMKIKHSSSGKSSSKAANKDSRMVNDKTS